MCASVSRIAVDGSGCSETDRVQESRASAIGRARFPLAWETVIRCRRVLKPIVFGEVT